MKLLLINPKFSESFWSLKWLVTNIMPYKRTVNPPLGLATLAALCPPDWEIEIIDENVEPVPLSPDADLVGVCGMGIQFDRQAELLNYYKAAGYFVVAGGSYVSLCPELYETIADTIIAGEAEYIWKEFCRDFEAGHSKPCYKEEGIVDLRDSPTPRFDLLKLKEYMSVSLQFSRGCPYQCEFCDIIVMFGRKPRTKSIQQVELELDLLRENGVQNVFFVDDNLIGNSRSAKQLISFLIEYQTRHDYRFNFGTEASLNLSRDAELLTLFRKANFEWVFIGIESPDENSLKEIKKYQNLKEDILTSVRTIYSHGIQVYGGFIIGFDNDTINTYNQQFQFITQSGIQMAMVGLLTALPKTPLYNRLQEEGRLIDKKETSDNTKLGTNFIPKQMGYEEMVDGYRSLYFQLMDNNNIAQRIINKLKYLKSPVYQGGYSAVEQFRMFLRLTGHGLLGNPRRLYHFIRSVPINKPEMFPVVVHDWIVGISMQDYVRRYFKLEFGLDHRLSESYFKKFEINLHKYLRTGALELSLKSISQNAAHFSVKLKGLVDTKFFIQVTKHLKKILRKTASTVTLNIEECQEAQIENFQKCLKKLSVYGDRITIRVDKRLMKMIAIDSSIFNLELSVEPIRSIETEWEGTIP